MLSHGKPSEHNRRSAHRRATFSPFHAAGRRQMTHTAGCWHRQASSETNSFREFKHIARAGDSIGQQSVGVEHPRRNAAAARLPCGGIPLGKRHAQKSIDEFLETHAQIGRLTFVKPSRNIRFYCQCGSHDAHNIKVNALMQRGRPTRFT